MLKYGNNTPSFKPEKLHKLNVDRQSASLIENGSRVLEIGCATGFMGEYLIKNKNCTVIGVELGKDEAAIAKKKLTKVLIGNIESDVIIREINALGKFDVVFASALIEHLKDPWAALKTWKKFLTKGGYIVISTSNIAHWSMRLKIIRGEFAYQEYGILDNTHLRFFTYKTFQDLVKESGFSIEYLGIDPVGGGYPKISKIGSKIFPNLFAYQMVIKART